MVSAQLPALESRIAQLLVLHLRRQRKGSSSHVLHAPTNEPRHLPNRSVHAAHHTARSSQCIEFWGPSGVPLAPISRVLFNSTLRGALVTKDRLILSANIAPSQ